MSHRGVLVAVSQMRVLLGVVACVFTCIAVLVFVGSAAADAPGWEVIGRSIPTYLPPGGEGLVRAYAFNLGATESAPGAVFTETLPEGLTATRSSIESCSGFGTRSVRCELPTVKAGQAIVVTLHVAVASGVSGRVDALVSVSGGGALGPTNVSVPVTISSGAPPSGFADFSTWATTPEGMIDTQAGSHPYDLMVSFALNATTNGYWPGGQAAVEEPAGGQARTINVNLPSGIIGNAQAVPQCPRKAFDEAGIESLGGNCPADTQIGENQATVQGLDLAAVSPIYNMVPPPGVAAQFAFTYQGIDVFIDSGVRTGGDNGITSHTRDLPQRSIIFDATKIWGVPGDPRHNIERCGEEDCHTGLKPVPFLTLPTSCGAPPEYTIEELGTWENESIVPALGRYAMQDNEGEQTGFTGCERLQPFKPEIGIAPDTSYSDTPAGLSVDVKMQQGLNPEELQAPGLKGTSVVLPEGIAINPGQATGLQACQSSQEAMGSEPDGEIKEGPISCPAASKVGTVEITTPLLRDKLQGNVYILGSNPPNLQLLIAASGDGVNLKLVGDTHLDENTGQLVTTFENTPDVPFTDFKLNFSGGAQAALATPTQCGVYESKIDFTPWSTPFIEDQHDTSLFGITAGPNGSPCVWPMPFSPAMQAGATTDQAGGYTDFTMLLTRGDEQQRIRSLSFKTPEGLLGMISSVVPCPEPQASQGACTSASQIGHTVVGAGPGPYPFYIPQAGAPPAAIYLTGPYQGAPFGLSIVVPLIAGPFNLGTEVVRARLDVDPHTSQVTITTDPLPVTEKGIPDDLRLIDAVIDKPGFMFNPTNCEPMSFSGTATSTEGATAPLASHFQMGSCQALKFKPDFKVSTSGKTSRKNGASLTAKVIYPVGNLGYNQASSQSNIKTVKVNLPKQLPSRLPTLQKACTAKQFDTNPAGCPAASIVGHAKAITPVLPVPLEGPAYFVSHGGEAFPNLIVVLQGDNVTVDLVGDTFIDEHTNITSSTFKQVPDVPIESFELNLPEGPYSALAANTNLCKVKGGLKMPTIFTGQNGATLKQNTPIAITHCNKTKNKRKGRHGSRHAKHGHGKGR